MIIYCANKKDTLCGNQAPPLQHLKPMSPRGSEGGGVEENFALTTANQTTTTKGDNNKREEGGLENNQNISGLKVFAHSH